MYRGEGQTRCPSASSLWAISPPPNSHRLPPPPAAAVACPHHLFSLPLSLSFSILRFDLRQRRRPSGRRRCGSGASWCGSGPTFPGSGVLSPGWASMLGTGSVARAGRCPACPALWACTGRFPLTVDGVARVVAVAAVCCDVLACSSKLTWSEL